jgi:hypothetical protein
VVGEVGADVVVVEVELVRGVEE